VAELNGLAEMIVTWPVASVEEARRLAAWGVDGVITERYEALAEGLA
jgi:glycerophosphoryl diester phosphodiesterase